MMRFLLLGCLLPLAISAKDLGIIGQLYAIQEEDFLEFIESRIRLMQANGRWQALQKDMQQGAIRYRDRPNSITEITATMTPRTWLMDPSIVLDRDIITSEGVRIATAGTRINPLVYKSLSKTLIFYNGDDPKQVTWVLTQEQKLKGRTKLILVSGSLLEQEKQLKKPVYFDQAGKLTARFGIKHVPALVFQEGLKLKIMEVVP